MDQEICYDFNYLHEKEIPHFKIGQYFYFGGLRRYLKIPISTPGRVIV
jgi:hypothetical protein